MVSPQVNSPLGFINPGLTLYAIGILRMYQNRWTIPKSYDFPSSVSSGISPDSRGSWDHQQLSGGAKQMPRHAGSPMSCLRKKIRVGASLPVSQNPRFCTKSSFSSKFQISSGETRSIRTSNFPSKPDSFCFFNPILPRTFSNATPGKVRIRTSESSILMGFPHINHTPISGNPHFCHPWLQEKLVPKDVTALSIWDDRSWGDYHR